MSLGLAVRLGDLIFSSSILVSTLIFLCTFASRRDSRLGKGIHIIVRQIIQNTRYLGGLATAGHVYIKF